MEDAGPVIGRITLEKTPAGTGLANIALITDRDGSYFAGASGAIGGQTSDWPGFDTSASYAVSGSGIELPTRLWRAYRWAPVGATTLSPLTMLIYWSDQNRVLTALGLDAKGAFPLPAQAPLTYSATQDLLHHVNVADTPGAFLGANIGIETLAMAARVFSRAPGVVARDDFDNASGLLTLAAYIQDHPGVSLASEAGVKQFLLSLRPANAQSPYLDEIYDAAAYLTVRFFLQGRTVPLTPSVAPELSMAIAGQLRARLLQLATANNHPAAVSALALTTNQLVAERQIFAQQLPVPAGNFMPSPDFIQVPVGGNFVMPRVDSNTLLPDLISNDVLLDLGIFKLDLNSAITAITVPADQQAAISAVLRPDQSVLVTAKPGFSGFAYYDYAVTRTTGETGVGRVYVAVL